MTDSLIEYIVEIDWQKPERPADYAVIARDKADAIEIARRLFRQSHTKECQIISSRVRAENT